MERPRLIFTTVLGGGLFTLSLTMLIYYFWSNHIRIGDYPKFPVNAHVSVIATCAPEDLLIISTGLIMGRENSYIAIRFHSEHSLDDPITVLQKCESIYVYKEGFEISKVELREDNYDLDKLLLERKYDIEIESSFIGRYGFKPSDINVRTHNVALIFEVKELLTKTSSDKWALDYDFDAKVSGRGVDAKSVENTAASYATLSYIVEDNLSIEHTNIQPKVTRLKSHYTYESPLVYRPVDPDDSYVMGGAGIQTKERFIIGFTDNQVALKSSVVLMIASTIFGASISILIECFLSLELYRTLFRRPRNNHDKPIF